MELIAELLLVCSCLLLYFMLHWHLAAIETRMVNEHLEIMEKLTQKDRP